MKKLLVLISVLSVSVVTLAQQESPVAVFGKCRYEITDYSQAYYQGCKAFYGRKDGYGTFQCAYDKAVKNCQALFDYCYDDSGTGNTPVGVMPGELTSEGKKTCEVEAAVKGIGAKKGAGPQIQKMREAAMIQALGDQY
jgi:hypothetical protein